MDTFLTLHGELRYPKNLENQEVRKLAANAEKYQVC